MLHLAGTHLQVALNALSSTSLLASLGAVGLFLVLFAETGLLVGFFLPGDSLLVTAGLLCGGSSSSGLHLSLPVVLLASVAGALLGAQTGFLIGRNAGRPLIQRSRSRHLHKGAERSQELLSRYGYRKAIVIARFLPIVRTVLNPMVGALDFSARTFTIWQVIGGLIWAAGLPLAGYGLGSAIGNVDRYLVPIIAVIVVASFVPIGVEILRSRRTASRGSGHEDLPDPVRVAEDARDNSEE